MDYKFIKTGYIESVSGGDNEIILELVKIFGEQMADMSLEMRTLLDKNDYTALGMLAHKAKSSVAIMGMSDLADMLKTFELQTKDSQEKDKFEMYISRFEQETKGAISELGNFVKNLK
jgi:HPt (histidine-containing phosphotransfer) domain-containing protein